MEAPQIRIKAEGFRAINKIDIAINGITVVAGENSSGKSTVSKLLYFLYKTASNYDKLVTKKLRHEVRDLTRFLDILLHELGSLSKDRSKRDELRKEFSDLFKLNSKHIDEQLDNWKSFVRKIEEVYFAEMAGSAKKYQNARFKYILRDILEDRNFDQADNLPFERIVELLDAKFKEARGKIDSRPASLFIEALRSVFSDEALPKKFEVLEFNEQIFSLDKNHLLIPYSVQNTVYIDTPMMIGVDSDNEHWDDLDDLLVKKARVQYSEISQMISNEMIKGDVTVDDNPISSSNFSYKRADGSVFNLLDCATGIKSFAIIQLLLKNGTLNDKTLLIIDEPEVHLHPQWIIEYARLIVLLNKEVGIKFFIASHNPDMVSAIRYISEKEGLLDNLNFYLAEEASSKYQYNYKFLGTDIDPIFKSFNIAIDRINKYGI
jgi:predicted ATP-dependent endonuclease of OLD family